MTKFDSLGRRKRLYPQSTGKRVTLQPRDLIWFSKLHEHGALPSSYLHAFTSDKWRSEKRAKERLTDLFNEANTAHDSAYLTRPMQQFRTIDSRYNQLVYDVAKPAIKALKDAHLWREECAPKSGPWLHNHMTACITASIEIACNNRPDLNFIPAWRILGRANAKLRCELNFNDPTTGQIRPATLIPDALFGLEYLTDDGPRYRFFVVEAERGTEPITSKNSTRKSWLRNIAQYERYIGDGLYKQHLRLTAPMLLLNVVAIPERMEAMMSAAEAQVQIGLPWALFQVVNGFGECYRPGIPVGGFIGRPWSRVGLVGLCVGKA